LVNQLSPVEQIPFPESATHPLPTTLRFNSNGRPATATPAPEFAPTTQQHYDQDTTPHLTRVLPTNDSPRVTRLLADLRTQTGALRQAGQTTTSLRQPVVIRGSERKSTDALPASRRHRMAIRSIIFVAMAILTLVTALAVVPLATGNGHPFSLFSASGTLHNNNDGAYNANLIAQAATATAIVRQDGYDPNSGSSNNGIPPVYSGSGVTPDRFAFGNCTYWADLEYHNKTGYWVDWIGNAYQWAYGASAAGWIVSSTPHVYSIIVLQPYVEGAGYYGHVAVVEKINPDGSVLTSDMNWYANGGWDRVSYVTFTPGPGVSFVWHG
jgi:surface antigen